MSAPRDPSEPDFEAPESESLRKLFHHVVDEMPGHVIAAIAFVAFLFFYGLAQNLYRLTGRAFADLEFPLGVVTGALGSLVLSFVLLRVKYRKK